MKNNMKKLILILVSALFLISCNSKTPQCNKKVKPGDVWYKNDNRHKVNLYR